MRPSDARWIAKVIMANIVQHLSQGSSVHALHHHDRQQQVPASSQQLDSEAPLMLAFPSKTKTRRAEVVKPKGLS